MVAQASLPVIFHPAAPALKHLSTGFQSPLKGSEKAQAFNPTWHGVIPAKAGIQVFRATLWNRPTNP
jgi:hypothetical protein